MPPHATRTIAAHNASAPRAASTPRRGESTLDGTAVVRVEILPRVSIIRRLSGIDGGSSPRRNGIQACLTLGHAGGAGEEQPDGEREKEALIEGALPEGSEDVVEVEHAREEQR